MSDDRTRFESQIKHYDTRYGREFENALYSAIQGWGGLSFFTDEQVTEIRAEMIKAEWKSRCRRREIQAHNRAFLQSRLTKETTDARAS